ncbi:YlbG family protein [Gorillibacterium massiliense]|uniref:YlbG family protein n=1 Tax=Gorillibacterium massiliense TaxID=1280390 RepID=UPI0004B07916|nr:YlbG family protein [Gorillibacterium massiliense]
MFTERSGLIVWLNDSKPARNLEKYGTVHYISKRMNYVAMYVHTDRLEDTIRNIQRLPYVKKVENSYRKEIKTEYDKNIPDKTRFYSL